MKTIKTVSAVLVLAFALIGCRPDGGRGCDGVDILSGCFGAYNHKAASIDHDEHSGANVQFARIESPVIIR